MNYKVGANTIVENTSGLFDLARVDPTAAIRSQYRIGNEARGHT